MRTLWSLLLIRTRAPERLCIENSEVDASVELEFVGDGTGADRCEDTTRIVWDRSATEKLCRTCRTASARDGPARAALNDLARREAEGMVEVAGIRAACRKGTVLGYVAGLRG
jgi:hypothetical protein